MNSAAKYTVLRKKDSGNESLTCPSAVKPSTISYCAPSGIAASVHTRIAHAEISATCASFVNRRTNSGPAARASTNMIAVKPMHSRKIFFCASRTRPNCRAP